MEISNLKNIINVVLANSGRETVNEISEQTSLRNDLGFDSLKLAELTVRIEDQYGIDIFESGIVDKVSEIMEKMNNG